MRKFYPVSVIIVFAVVIFAIIMNGVSIGLYVSIPALIFVVVLTTGLLFGTFSPSEMGEAFRTAYHGTEPSALRKAIAFFRAMHHYLLWSGVLATLTGIIVLLATLGDETTVGFGAALALVTSFYAIVLSLALALPFKHAAEKRLAEADRSAT